MVFYFTSRCGEYTIYMGRDKYENESLITYGWDQDVWFHVDDLSSAHVYLRMKPGMSLDDLVGGDGDTSNTTAAAKMSDVLTDCASLVKANSIQGCKLASVHVVYTRWKNLKKTSDMVDGQVGFFRPENVRRISIEKNNSIVRQLEKTKVEDNTVDLYQQQQDRIRELVLEQKQVTKRAKQDQERLKQEAIQAKQKVQSAYDSLMQTASTTEGNHGTADASAAEDYEDDFF